MNAGDKVRRYNMDKVEQKLFFVPPLKSKTVKGSNFDHRSRRVKVMVKRIHFENPKIKSISKKKIEQTTLQVSFPRLLKKKSRENLRKVDGNR
jgi:hypothetical protein